VNAMQILSSQPWVERLGWTLVHFLWQGLAIAVLYAAARRGIAGKASPNARYLLACAALAAMMAAPLATWGLMRLSDAQPDAADRIRSTTPGAPTSPANASIIALPAPVRATVSRVRSAQFLPWVVILWLFGTAVFWVRLAGGWVVAARMRSMLVRRGPPEWQEILRELGSRIGLSRPVRLLVSALVQVPTVVGWLRPVVLVPVGALGGLPAEQLEALLLHELAHIRRHDYLVNILQSVAEALLFYQPAVWVVGAHSRRARTVLRRCRRIGLWRCAHVCARAGAVGSVPPRTSQYRGCRQWRISRRPYRKAAGPVAASRPHRSGTGGPRGRYSAGGRGIRIVRPVGFASRVSNGVSQTKYFELE